MKTSCEKCIFADYADSEEPCKMQIIEQAKKYHEISISDNNFFNIRNYYCRYGFSLEVYENNKHELESIAKVKEYLVDQSKIKYYLIIDVKHISNIETLCDSINKLSIRPGYVSFLLYSQNQTDIIINSIKNSLNKNIDWKIHNFLDNISLTDAVSTVFDTNAKKNETVYFWLNNDQDSGSWGEQIEKINNIIYIEQPECHAIFRSQHKDGLVLSFDQYQLMRMNLDSDIFKALDSIENAKFIYYA